MQKMTVFFDAAGTLLTVNGSVGERYAVLAREYGKDVVPHDIEAGFRRSFPNAPPLAFPGAPAAKLAELEHAWWHAVVRDVFAGFGPFPRFDDYFDALYAAFAQPEAWRLYPETRATLDTLRDRDYRLGVVSNFDARLFGLLEGLGIADRFDPIIASTRAGAAKPDPAIFQHALTTCGVSAEQAVHVGDTYELDVFGARAAGVAAILIDRVGHDTPPDCPVVRSLKEVPILLDRGIRD